MTYSIRFHNLIFLSSVLIAENVLAGPCGDILRQGVFDTLNQEMGNAQASQFNAMLCEEESDEKQRAVSGSAGARYGAFSGSASASKSSRDAYRKAMCSANASDQDLNSFSRFVRSSANPVIVDAWSKCTSMYQKGVVAELTQDIGTASIGAYVSGSTASVVGFDITPSSMSKKVRCTGTLSRATEDTPIELASTVQYLSCNGPVEAEPSGRPISAPEFTVNLKTTQGELQYFSKAFVRDITSEEAKAIRNEIHQAELRASAPAGAVLAFDLDACPNGWEPATELAGRTIVGAGAQAEDTSERKRGQRGGEESHVIKVGEMPKHNHGNGFLGNGNRTTAHFEPSSRRGYDVFLPVNKKTATVDSGGSNPHNNMQPFLVLTYCKKL